MKQLKNTFKDPYVELQEEDRKYGGRKLERPESEMRRDRRPLKNLKNRNHLPLKLQLLAFQPLEF